MIFWWLRTEEAAQPTWSGLAFSGTRGLSLPTPPRNDSARTEMRTRCDGEPFVCEAAGFMERGESRRHLMICGSRGVTDPFYVCAAVSAPARLEAAVQSLPKWLCRFINMKVFLQKLCRGSGLDGALREGTRTKDITTVFLFVSFRHFCGILIYGLHKPPHTPLSIQCAQHKHTQGKYEVCMRLQERLCFRLRLLWERTAVFTIIKPAADQSPWSWL